jgi:hypothetical protein
MKKHYSKYKTNRFQYKYRRKCHAIKASLYLGTDKDPHKKTYLQKLKAYSWAVCWDNLPPGRHPLKRYKLFNNHTPS